MWMLMIAVACTLSVGCRSKAEPTAGAPERELGHRVATKFKQTLLAELTAASAKGFPAAIEVCQSRAPAIAAELSREGPRVGRATRRPRNPQNRADGWKADALAQFEDLHARKQPLGDFVRLLPEGRVAYAEPLVIGELCLGCHGKELAPDVKQTLAARYPTDEATGYAVGDLRGVIWVEWQGI